ncbi:hypothetical protein BU23DRAFT_326489 [Bimuria novae-zelandiae CBS 107.79]|uniref:Uncharacterized protein n=1 Tax=Bimuria novae-zelandiae CBS 107.79 TaxID=1447943 RepID=A0A6A5UTW2_9PLEO|nr:hypothetical protein BU23DRAFT_326489 [Bimuria novae-zelandiae CBS 107.79]
MFILHCSRPRLVKCSRTTCEVAWMRRMRKRYGEFGGTIDWQQGFLSFSFRLAMRYTMATRSHCGTGEEGMGRKLGYTMGAEAWVLCGAGIWRVLGEVGVVYKALFLSGSSFTHLQSTTTPHRQSLASTLISVKQEPNQTSRSYAFHPRHRTPLPHHRPSAPLPRRGGGGSPSRRRAREDDLVRRPRIPE